MNLDQKFPSIADMERGAARAMPHFAFEYLRSGIGREVGLGRNRTALDDILFRPRYLSDQPTNMPDLRTEILGQRFDAPFGIAPFGLTGLMWPKAAEYAAMAAAAANIPMGLSSFATTPMDTIRQLGGENIWYQYYPVNDAQLEQRMLADIWDAGFRTLIVTVDIPTETRRDRDLRVGLSVPPKITLKTMLNVAVRPRWALATLAAGRPEFVNLLPYVAQHRGMDQQVRAIQNLMEGTITIGRLQMIRALWKGKLVIKGIMHANDAQRAFDAGADAIWVSNHGGRQLDAAKASVEVLAEIRAAVGTDAPIMADSGVRNGTDIARMLASGADFIFLGRAFIFAIAAVGNKGAEHACHVLHTELRTCLGQIGCPRPGELRGYLDG